jgi:hypothetical protein
MGDAFLGGEIGVLTLGAPLSGGDEAGEARSTSVMRQAAKEAPPQQAAAL